MDLKQLLERKQGRLKPRRRRMRPPTASKRAEVWYRDRLIEFVDSMLQTLWTSWTSPHSPMRPIPLLCRLQRALRQSCSD